MSPWAQPGPAPIGDDQSSQGRGLASDGSLALWQRRTERQLTTEDARQISENVVGFFRALLEWEAAAPNHRQQNHKLAFRKVEANNS